MSADKTNNELLVTIASDVGEIKGRLRTLEELPLRVSKLEADFNQRKGVRGFIKAGWAAVIAVLGIAAGIFYGKAQ